MRQILTLANAKVRERAMQLIRCAPVGYRVEIREAKHTDLQRKRMWAMLSDFAAQVTHSDGHKHPKEHWKIACLHKLGRETQFMPSFDGDELLPLGQSSRELSKAEMSDVIELLYAEGAARGVVWTDPTEDVAA